MELRKMSAFFTEGMRSAADGVKSFLSRRTAPSLYGAPFAASSVGPRVRTRDMLIALLPVYLWAVYLYGVRVLTLAGIAVFCGMLTEGWICVFTGHLERLRSCSFLVTGLLFVCFCPVTVPLWVPAIGAAAAEALYALSVRWVGRPTCSGAVAAAVLLRLLWPRTMTVWVAPFTHLPAFAARVIPETSALAVHPMAAIRAGDLTAYSLYQLVIGVRPGLIGELSPILLAVGGIYLLCRKRIRWRAPVACLVVAAALFYLLPQHSVVTRFMLYELFSGSLLLCALYAAGDENGVPIGQTAALLYGAFCAFCIVMLRYYAPWEDGAAVALLLSGLLAHPLEYAMLPPPYGCSYRPPKSESDKK